jgi:hypothetical protein
MLQDVRLSAEEEKQRDMAIASSLQEAEVGALVTQTYISWDWEWSSMSICRPSALCCLSTTYGSSDPTAALACRGIETHFLWQDKASASSLAAGDKPAATKNEDTSRVNKPLGSGEERDTTAAKSKDKVVAL